jgi:hypothetical protein
VAFGLTGYGPESDDGFHPLSGVREVAATICDDLENAIQNLVDSADTYAEHECFKEAWFERKRADELGNFASNLDASREQTPMYAENPELWEQTLTRLIDESFPLDVSDNTRLYAWECSEDECETTAE